MYGRIESIPLAHKNLDSYQTDDGTLQTIMDMEPVARVTMLRKRISSLETLSSLGRTDCAWLFTLCAAIDTPLDKDTSASLRCLLRKCAALRTEKMCFDDEVIMLNILAIISGEYFGELQSN
jgi:gem associated protein 2